MSEYKNDDVTVGDIFSIVKARLILICMVVGIFAVLGVAFALSKPNVYQAQVLLIPAANSSDSGSGLSGQFGGLAALAGVKLGGGADKSMLHLEHFQSRKFLTKFIAQHQLEKDIFAAEKISGDTGEIVYDQDKLARLEPNAQNPASINYIYEQFIEDDFVLEANSKTGLVTLSVFHASPVIAKKLTDLLVQDINQEIRKEEILDADKSIKYLEVALENTNVLETKRMFYQLIEQQHRTKMLATVKEEYAFKVIDPSIVPERKYGPNRALIVVIFALVGGILSVCFVVVVGLRAKD
ncbi:Wzz/FepE/Etk N-terminal domain-containing protein [Pseudoalteromonas byunsanensis]|uniref:Polysaccharide chain length determinant N-terminal domain-containing protein n=1 Tax=Pseudoalteromonas byunsanensis TaxID=327939 RepID=A0A1S1N7F8_9GAMM|nr:Wzz/FepE/Etk N-terminal domain-containing protein [Pseudoalteromonas byunsanensis]OHU95300.1 hypothetical protein BIW53_11315 [Pseudoalteromonas byunsanensis]